MTNIILLVIEILFYSLTLFWISKQKKKEYLYFWILILTIITNIMVLKKMDILGFEIPLGIISYVNIFTTCNLINQQYGKENRYKIASLITITSGVTYIFLLLSSLPQASSLNVNTSLSYNQIYQMNFISFLIFLTTMIISLLINFELYFHIRKKKNKIVFSQISSSSIIFFIDTILYTLFINIKEFDIINIVITIIIIYVIKIIASYWNTFILKSVCKLEK